MKKALMLLAGACMIALLIGPASARDSVNGSRRISKDWASYGVSTQCMPADTFCMVWYTFETSDWQGWTREDETAQRDTFFHVDDFAGLGGGGFGRLNAIEGTKSMWCGAPPNASDSYFCSWQMAPGYGNGWSQFLGTDAFSFLGMIGLEFHCRYDSERDYDFTTVEYDAGGGNWRTIAEFTGRGDTVGSYQLALSLAKTKLRFHFTSDRAWSDEDGLLDTDGGCIIDSISVRDAGTVNNLETFESCAVGAEGCGIWFADEEAGYGMYSGLGSSLRDYDLCGDNFATQVEFFTGSPDASAEYPGLYNTPWCAGVTHSYGPCQDELAVSPLIDMTKYSTHCDDVQDASIPSSQFTLLGPAGLCFTVYRDLAFSNLVFYVWHVRNVVAGCPGPWLDRGLVYYGSDEDFSYVTQDIGDLVGDDPVQIAVGVVDMCSSWYSTRGDCAYHTPSPYIDNVRLYRVACYKGPQWGYRALDLFQDNFPEDGMDIESYVRADAANDINPYDNPIIRPGDSIVVSCNSPTGGGIASDETYGGPAVYLHVKATYIGPEPSKPVLHGGSLCGGVAWGGPAPGNETFRLIDDDGTWTVIQCDSARTAMGAVAKNQWMCDLNDSLFTRGYRIEYYFSARDVEGNGRALPMHANIYGPYFEWTCLPSQNSDVLFVDAADGHGSRNGEVDDFWMSVFNIVLAPPNNLVDRYDVNAPTCGVSNGLGSRAKGDQLIDQYRKIVWDSGDLDVFTICSGTMASDKSNDAFALMHWMENSEHRCGLWILGDGVAEDLDAQARGGSDDALALMNMCGVVLVDHSYYEMTGGYVGGGNKFPLVTGDVESGVLVDGGVPDRFRAFGGCPNINHFDVIDQTENGLHALDYPNYGEESYYAGISSDWLNGSGDTIRTMWFGFSCQYVRDDTLVPGAVLDRNTLAARVFAWMDNDINEDITPVDNPTPEVNKLAQNFPNPFNPSTSIKFDVKEKGIVTLEVYNIAGQHIRTLVKGIMDAGSHRVTWDGKNDRGGVVASGIYFCKMNTKNFSQTRKIVMLR
ncbi:MAG: T9SS type A sorting domain-containing protein [Candidatus Krumholzibacteria bacterium]|nr:T9SS type A sorting domain-containing protein [Candidatus Krumholzibacteria bacterium]